VVNPYDPTELYATDWQRTISTTTTTTGDIKVSRDAGQSWNAIPGFKNIATHNGEFDFACGGAAVYGGDPRYSGRQIFATECPLEQIVFVPNHPEVRVAVLYPGGVAFSRDAGLHWIPLDVTNASEATDLIKLPHSAFYDPTPHPTPNSKNGYTSLYVALEGQGVERVDGPFATLEGIVLVYKPPFGIAPAVLGAAVQVNTQAGLVGLEPGADGLLRANILFDVSVVNAPVTLSLLVGGEVVQQVVWSLTDAQRVSGVISLSNGSCEDAMQSAISSCDSVGGKKNVHDCEKDATTQEASCEKADHACHKRAEDLERQCELSGGDRTTCEEKYEPLEGSCDQPLFFSE
jgi:hypothetical protein